MKFFTFWSVWVLQTLAYVSEIEIEALWKLYNATNGQTWKWSQESTKWNFNSPNINPCEDDWQGIVCYRSPTTNCSDIYTRCNVSFIYLSQMNLTGTLPLEIGNFTELQQLEMSSNSLKGRLPTSLGKLTSLRSLYLDDNYLSQTLPSELSFLSHLSTLAMSSNSIEGTIPSTLLTLSSLKYISLQYNCLSGSIPSQLSTTITSLYLLSNQLNGSIPESIGQTTNLIHLFLNYNFLTGSVPETFGSLVRLETLSLCSNQLIGAIPYTLGLLTKLQYLDLFYNSLSHSLPQSICDMTRLYYFSLYRNSLTGSIPTCLNQLTRLDRIYLHHNSLNGTLPTFTNLIKLFELDVSYNSLSGHLPDSLFDLPSLFYLKLDDNRFSGPLSENLSHLSQLMILSINNNFLTHSLPVMISTSLQSLQLVYIDNNLFTGPIPLSYSLLPNLRYFSAYSNYLSQSIPSNIGNFTSLVFFDVNTNDLTGSLPSSIGSLTQLEYLHLFQNHLSGTIPTSLSHLKLLKYLLFQQNHLSSHVPLDIFLPMTKLEVLQLQRNHFHHKFFQLINTSLVEDGLPSYGLNELRLLDISQNLFTGSFPSVIFHFSSLESLVLTSNCFHGKLNFDEVACHHNKLQVMILDGLASCSQHTISIWNPLYSTHVHAAPPHSAMSGPIPSCLFQIPQLRVLHLGGNHLTGSVPDIPFFSNLLNLSLTHNKLSGTIPDSILHHDFVELDLSHNKITGTLDNMKNSPKSSFNVKNNRLSGRIPTILSKENEIEKKTSKNKNKTTTQVNILEGNAFTCKNEFHQPDSDPGKGRYPCGSENIDDALITWVIIGGFSLILLLFLSYRGYFSPLLTHLHFSLTTISQSHVLLFKRMMSHKSPLLHDEKTLPARTSIHQMAQIVHLSSMHQLQSLSFRISFFFVIFILPIYCLLKTIRDVNGNYLYSTYFIQQTWYPTGIYISGTVPAILLLFSWVVIILYTLFNIMKSHRLYSQLYYPEKYCQSESIFSTATRLSSKTPFDIDENNPTEEEILSLRESQQLSLFNNSNQTDISEESFQSISPSLSKIQLTSQIFYSLLLFMIVILDIILVFAINFSYLLLQESHTSSRNKLLGQLMLALFKAVFSNAFIPVLTNMMFEYLHYSRSAHLLIRTSSLLFNNLIIPALVIALTSSSCYLNMFYSNDAISESFELTNSTALCDYQFTDTGLVECNVYGTAYFESEAFIPGFAYSYQCSSYFAATYFPVYIYSYALLSFIVPLFIFIYLLNPSISQWIPKQFQSFLPSYLRHIHTSRRHGNYDTSNEDGEEGDGVGESDEEEEDEIGLEKESEEIEENEDEARSQTQPLQSHFKESQLTNALGVMSSLLYHFSMLLCLGILVPILGVIIMIHITILVIQYDIRVGLYFSFLSEEQDSVPDPSHPPPRPPRYRHHLRAYQNEIRSLWRGPYLFARYILILVVVVMSCFLLDQAGDHHGWRHGIWVIPTVVLTACLPAWFLWKYSEYFVSLSHPSLSSILKVDYWLLVVDWFLTMRGRERSRGSYKVLTTTTNNNNNKGKEK